MFSRYSRFLVLLLMLSSCTPARSNPTPTEITATSHTQSATLPASPHGTGTAPVGWVMFHAEESHSGVASGTGRIDPQSGPEVMAQYRLFDEPATENDLTSLRWTSTLPLADLNGDGQLEIVVTTPAVAAPTLARRNGEPIPNMVLALKYAAGNPELEKLWSYQIDSPPGEGGLDTYGPALADADGDSLPDVIFTARDGFVRALKGTDGSLIWSFNMGGITEAGPMLSDLNGDGIPEVIVVTDCRSGSVECSSDGQAALYVLPLRAEGENQPMWQMDYPYKMDSSEPAIADVPGLGKVILAGTWGGELLAVWRDQGGEVRSVSLKMSDVDHGIPGEPPPVIRTSALVDYTHDGPLVVFGWLPSDLNVTDARLTAVNLRADGGTLILEPAWTISSIDDWKSSPALVPQADGNNLIVTGYGLGIGPPPTQSGSVGSCQSEYVFGGVTAVDEKGNIVWNQSFGNEEGNLRASAAVADIDGDGRLEVVIPAGCYGDLHAFDAVTGTPEWTLKLGPRTQTSPSIGDVTGDGSLDIVIASYNGLIYVLGGG